MGNVVCLSHKSCEKRTLAHIPGVTNDVTVDTLHVILKLGVLPFADLLVAEVIDRIVIGGGNADIFVKRLAYTGKCLVTESLVVTEVGEPLDTLRGNRAGIVIVIGNTVARHGVKRKVTGVVHTPRVKKTVMGTRSTGKRSRHFENVVGTIVPISVRLDVRTVGNVLSKTVHRKVIDVRIYKVLCIILNASECIACGFCLLVTTASACVCVVKVIGVKCGGIVNTVGCVCVDLDVGRIGGNAHNCKRGNRESRRTYRVPVVRVGVVIVTADARSVASPRDITLCLADSCTVRGGNNDTHIRGVKRVGEYDLFNSRNAYLFGIELGSAAGVRTVEIKVGRLVVFKLLPRGIKPVVRKCIGGRGVRRVKHMTGAPMLPLTEIDCILVRQLCIVHISCDLVCKREKEDTLCMAYTFLKTAARIITLAGGSGLIGDLENIILVPSCKVDGRVHRNVISVDVRLCVYRILALCIFDLLLDIAVKRKIVLAYKPARLAVKVNLTQLVESRLIRIDVRVGKAFHAVDRKRAVLCRAVGADRIENEFLHQRDLIVIGIAVKEIGGFRNDDKVHVRNACVISRIRARNIGKGNRRYTVDRDRARRGSADRFGKRRYGNIYRIAVFKRLVDVGNPCAAGKCGIRTNLEKVISAR